MEGINRSEDEEEREAGTFILLAPFLLVHDLAMPVFYLRPQFLPCSPSSISLIPFRANIITRVVYTLSLCFFISVYASFSLEATPN